MQSMTSCKELFFFFDLGIKTIQNHQSTQDRNVPVYESSRRSPQTSKRSRMSCLYPSLYKLLRNILGKLPTRSTSKRNGKRCQRHQETVQGNCCIRTVYTLFDATEESCRQCQTRKSYVFHGPTYQSG